MAAAPLLPDQQRWLFECSLSCPQPAWPAKAGYAEGVTVVCGIGADESDRDEVAKDIVHSTITLLFTNPALMSKLLVMVHMQFFFNRGRIPDKLHCMRYPHRGSRMVGIAIK